MCSNCSGNYEDPEMTAYENDREASEQGVAQAIEQGQECPECGHAATHGKYGCEYERGDAWVTGNQAGEPTVLMAQGPCGCKHHNDDQERVIEVSRSVRAGTDLLLSALRKAGAL